MTLKEIARRPSGLGGSNIFNIQASSPERINQFYQVIVDTISEKGIAFIPIKEESLPNYRPRFVGKYGEGLLIIDGVRLWASNIAVILYGNESSLKILLRNEMILLNGVGKSEFTLTFKDRDERRIFHDELVMIICSGSKIKYPY